MTSLSRRAFLAGCGVAGVGTVSASLNLRWTDIHLLATEKPMNPGQGVLVLVTLYGGNDGINTVIPYTANEYYDARPDLAYSADEVIDLDGQFGLNPGMRGLGQLFHEGSLAIIQGVGYPDQDRSHFRSMDIWQTGSIDNSVGTGWIGRWLDQEKNGDPLRAISVGSVLPMLAIGEKTTAATILTRDSTQRADQIKLISSLSEPDPSDNESMSAVRNSYLAASKSGRQFNEAFDNAEGPQASAESPPDESLSAQLDVVSHCIRAGLPTQVYCVSTGGFDTHADEKGTQQGLLRAVDRSLTKFLEEMSGHDRGQNVVLMAYSEFGRRVAANASDGTDHGTSGPVFVAGKPVRGGFYGDAPSLTDLEGGDLKTTNDFRDIYSELMTSTLAADPDAIVGSKRKPLGFLA
ncbi:MAG: DUF1501 domain-containing protein [Mycobacterium sp.]